MKRPKPYHKSNTMTIYYLSSSESPSSSSVAKRTSSLASRDSGEDFGSDDRLCLSSSSSLSSNSSNSSNDTSEDILFVDQGLNKFFRRSSNRSWSQQGRLWLLQSKRRLLLWKRLLVILVTLLGTSWTLVSQCTTYYVYQKQQQRQSTTTRTTMIIDTMDNYHQGRVLFQPLPNTLLEPLQVTGYHSLQAVGYSKKPMLMGYLWQPSADTNIFDDDDSDENDKDKDIHQKQACPEKDALIVRLDPYDYSIQKVEEVELLQAPPFSTTLTAHQNRRSLIQPNYQALFLPMLNRSVVFDINYTESIPPMSFEEKDEGRAWPVPENCEPQYDWQNATLPTCNIIHEQDVAEQLTTTSNMEASLLAGGGYRNVWMIRNGTHLAPGQQEPPVAFKTLLFERDWYEVQFERHDLDAMASAVFQGSPYILNMYGHCGTSGAYEFASGGHLRDFIAEWGSQFTPEIKMELAYNVMAAIADLHNYVKEGMPWIAHTDIFPDQFVRMGARGKFKLNDFNRARWLHKNRETNETCGFTFPRNRGKFRSPEEYAYQPETEKVDIFSAGNVLYVLLTGGEYPFAKRSRDTVKKVLARGQHQKIPDIYKESQHPLERALVDAIHMCWIHDPNRRATAREVEQFLSNVIQEYEEHQRRTTRKQ